MPTCAKCGVELTERYHIAGRDFCVNCQRSIARPIDPSVEHVRGTIIGGDDGLTRYVFVTQSGYHHTGRFASDPEAIAWFREQYPDAYKQGAEMRVYDV